MINQTIAEVQVSYAPHIKTETVITGSSTAYNLLKEVWNDYITYKESFYVLLLNRANKVLGYNLLSLGGTSGTIVDVKAVLQLAIKCNAFGIIVAHNHPSGNTKPSIQDKQITNKLKNACNLIDIKLLDHLIVTEESFYSFSDNLEI